MFEKRKKWLKLTFWHPLKPHRFSWVVLIIILIGLLVLHEKFNLIDKFGIETSTYYFIAGIFITFIISIYVFYYTQEETKRLEYADALKKLVIEIGKNKQRFDEFESNVNMRCKEFEENKIWKWMPKQNSFTNWADGQNFQYKYFATNAYFHFVNQGHILNTKYLEIPKGNIGNIYEICTDFSTELQLYERNIRNNKNSLTSESIKHELNCRMLNKYAYEHINGGFISNYNIIKNQLSEYYDFEKEISK